MTEKYRRVDDEIFQLVELIVASTKFISSNLIGLGNEYLGTLMAGSHNSC